jgi:branched-chain amino acid transport system substrate-binding protein
MSSSRKGGVSRRDFLQTTAVGALAGTGVLAAPSLLRAQGAGVKLGILQPVTGALSYSGQQGKLGAQLAIDEINAAGGVKGMGKIEVTFGDAQSTPEGGTAEVEKMNAAGIAAIVATICHIWLTSASPTTSSRED